MSLTSLGIIRGFIGQIIGTLAGLALVILLRLALGIAPVWQPELTWVIAILTGAVGFLVGVGAVTDWFKWMVGIETPLHHGPPVGKPAWTRYFSVDYNHKIIGIQYTVTAIVMLCIGGAFAVIFRTELARSGFQFLNANEYNTILGLHGWAALFAIFIGIGGLANYLVPLMIGADDMAFPRLNAFAYWINVPAIVYLLMSLFFGGWDAGWTIYPPLSIKAPMGIQFVLLAVFLLGFSSILGSLNLIATMLMMRPKGMSLFRMPIFCWAVLSASLIQLTATQFIAQVFLMVSFERTLGMGFFDPAAGGTPILFQHLFWFYSHPAVYVWVLPGLGVISEILPVFARKPLFGYRWIALSSLAIALVGFLVWGHHMFTSGYAPYLRVPFMLATLLVAVPTGVKFFSWLGTLWGGKLSFETPMLFTLGAISVFLIGGLSGPPLATVTSDLNLHDSYFVVGHFHATIFGGFTFPFVAALYFWYPKVTGRMYNEGLGKLHFWIMTPAFWMMSLGQMSVGVMGMRRRIADYDPLLGNGHIQAVQMVVTLSAFLIAFSILLMIFNFFHSAEMGRVAGNNPWRSRSPEWQIPSPVPEHSFANPIQVVGEPYDYGLPGSTYITMAPVAGDD
ncbi:MAG: cbb3-type cytochrome c oxidase subunit I [Caldilineaceae bacterium]